MEDAHDFGQLSAAHPGHVEVGDDQIEPTLALADQLEGCLAVGGFQHLPPVRLEHPSGDPAHFFLVVYQQDDPALAAVGRPGRTGWIAGAHGITGL